MLQIEEWLSGSQTTINPTLRLIAAILHVHNDNIKEAIQHIRFESNMEQ